MSLIFTLRWWAFPPYILDFGLVHAKRFPPLAPHHHYASFEGVIVLDDDIHTGILLFFIDVTTFSRKAYALYDKAPALSRNKAIIVMRRRQLPFNTSKPSIRHFYVYQYRNITTTTHRYLIYFAWASARANGARDVDVLLERNGARFSMPAARWWVGDTWWAWSPFTTGRFKVRPTSRRMLTYYASRYESR